MANYRLEATVIECRKVSWAFSLLVAFNALGQRSTDRPSSTITGPVPLKAQSTVDEKVMGKVSGGNLPPDLEVMVFDQQNHVVDKAYVRPDGSFSLRFTKIEAASKAEGWKAIFIRKDGTKFAETKPEWVDGSFVFALPSSAYFRVRLVNEAKDVDGNVWIDGEATGRTGNVISTLRGLHHLDAGNDPCRASLKRHSFFNLNPKKPEEIELKCGQQD